VTENWTGLWRLLLQGCTCDASWSLVGGPILLRDCPASQLVSRTQSYHQQNPSGQPPSCAPWWEPFLGYGHCWRSLAAGGQCAALPEPSSVVTNPVGGSGVDVVIFAVRTNADPQPRFPAAWPLAMIRTINWGLPGPQHGQVNLGCSAFLALRMSTS
jgi:hypothetical protein